MRCRAVRRARATGPERRASMAHAPAYKAPMDVEAMTRAGDGASVTNAAAKSVVPPRTRRACAPLRTACTGTSLAAPSLTAASPPFAAQGLSTEQLQAGRAYRGFYKCKSGSCSCPCCGVYLMPCCGGCCLYAVWTVFGLPLPGMSCTTGCLCGEGTAYITSKSGVKTGELLVIDAQDGTLAFYADNCGTMSEAPQCWCSR